MNLSKRERFLISLLLFVLLWALAYRGWIGPEYEALMKTRQQVKTLQDEKGRADLYLEHFPDLEQRLADLKEQEAGEFFYRNIDDVFMDQKLQEIAGNAGVEITRMSIGEPEAVTEEITNEVKDQAVKNESLLFVTTVTLEVKCPDVSHVMELADGVYRESGSMMISYMDLETSHEEETQTGGGSLEAGGMRGIVEVRFYYEKTK